MHEFGMTRVKPQRQRKHRGEVLAMETLIRSGYREKRVRGGHPAETMAMECILCFAVMKKLEAHTPSSGVSTAGQNAEQILREEL
jgi:hypothetical protein